MGMFDSLMDPGQIGQNALLGFQQGRQMRQENDTRNALATLAQNPDDPNAYETLAKANPELAIQYRGQMGRQQAEQQKQEQDQLVRLGRLLDHARDPQTYQEALAAARQSNIDVSKAPAQYDPTWINQQKLIVSQFQADGGQQISGLARELQDAGYQPGTPEFTEAMGIALQGKYAPQYTDAQGNLRQARLPNLPRPGQPAGAPAVGTIEDGHRFKGGNPADPNAWEPVAQSQPQMVVTPRELDALVRQFGPDEVQRRLDSGVVAVRN